MATNRILTLSDAGQLPRVTDVYESSYTSSPVSSYENPPVVITGIQMSFGSMVRLALKCGMASLVAAAVVAAVLGIIYFGSNMILSAIQR